jgi:methylglutaconyl-CoA hydratase
MDDEIIKLDIDDHGIATITLNRPEIHNAFDDHMITTLGNLFDDLAESKNTRVVVIKANGKSFSAGADLNWMKKAASYNMQQNQIDAFELASMLSKLFHLPKLTIACVQGAAMGGGLGLASCCDIVIAHKKTKFALSEVKLGLIPATIAPYVLRAIGERQARRYFQTGERFDGPVAKSLGLVHELADSDKQMAEILDRILSDVQLNAPGAMAESKALCLDLAGKQITTEILEDTSNRIAKRRMSDEGAEGISAFLEKRKAQFN